MFAMVRRRCRDHGSTVREFCNSRAHLSPPAMQLAGIDLVASYLPVEILFARKNVTPPTARTLTGARQRGDNNVMENSQASSPSSAASATAHAANPGSSAVRLAPALAASVEVPVPTPPASAATTIAVTLTQSPLPTPSLWENGTVLVAFFALVGVLITIFGAHKRMLRELRAAADNAALERDQARDQARLEREHAALEAHRERIATTRRQVYLEAVEAFGKAQMFLGSLGKQDLANLDYQTGIGPLLIAVQRVSVVGEMGTVNFAREMSSMVNRRFYQALIQLMPMSAHKALVKNAHEEWASAQIEIKRILAAMTNHNENVKADPDGFDALVRSLEIQQQRAKNASAAEQKGHAGIVELQREYLQTVVKSARDMALHLDLMADSIRKELNIETDFELFRAQTIKMIAEADEVVAELQAAFTELSADR